MVNTYSCHRQFPARRPRHESRRMHGLLLALLISTAAPWAMSTPAAAAVAGAVAGIAAAPQSVVDGSDGEDGDGAGWRPPVAPKIVVQPPVDAETASMLEQQWGITLLAFRRTAEGYMLDLRFRVLDVDKALPLFDSRNKPMVTVARSNAKLPVPAAAKIGSFRTVNRGKNIRADKNYFIMFANPDRHVKPDDEVSIEIGDFKVSGLRVN